MFNSTKKKYFILAVLRFLKCILSHTYYKYEKIVDLKNYITKCISSFYHKHILCIPFIKFYFKCKFVFLRKYPSYHFTYFYHICTFYLYKLFRYYTFVLWIQCNTFIRYIAYNIFYLKVKEIFVLFSSFQTEKPASVLKKIIHYN